MGKIMGQNMGRLISEVGAILLDLDIKNLVVSLNNNNPTATTSGVVRYE